MEFINRDTVSSVIRAQGSRMFSLTFIKKDGSKRKLNTRKGVRAKLVGGTSTLKDSPVYWTAYDLQKHAWRCFNIEKVVEIRAQGKVITP